MSDVKIKDGVFVGFLQTSTAHHLKSLPDRQKLKIYLHSVKKCNFAYIL
jgi:hypothetical protein